MQKYGQTPDETPPWPVDGFARDMELPPPQPIRLSSKLQKLHDAKKKTPPQASFHFIDGPVLACMFIYER